MPDPMKHLHAAFCDHPASVGETYTAHLCAALGFALRMVAGGTACAVHAILPFVFVKTASQTIDALHSSLVEKRRRKSAEGYADDYVI